MNDYDPKKQPTFISYLDMNNLYGWAMSGFFLEVDLEYPDELFEYLWRLFTSSRKTCRF